MRATILMDIAATHLRVTLTPSPSTWTRRVLRALASKPDRPGSIAELSDADNAPQPQMPDGQVQTMEERVAFSDRGPNDDPVVAVVDAAAQALQALRTRCSSTLDGCSMNVRTGVTLSSISVVPLDFSVGATQSDRQLQLIAQGVVREALGADARAQQVRCKVQADNAHLCVVALGASFLTSIQALCEAQRLKFASCQPAIIERLDSELAASARSRDSRTLVWTELDASGKRHALVNFLRIVNGSAATAWRTIVPRSQESTSDDELLQATTERFLIAAGAAQDEQVVHCVWPGLSPASPPIAATELQA